MKVECITCFNESAFRIFAIERLGESTDWNILLICQKCQTGQTIRVKDCNMENEVRDKLRDILKPDKEPKYRVYEQFAYDFNPETGSYDFSEKKKIRRMEN